MVALIVVLVIVFGAPYVIYGLGELFERVCDGCTTQSKAPMYTGMPTYKPPEDPPKKKDDWNTFIDSQRYAGHSYGESIDRIRAHGRTYGYNEKW